MSRLAPGAIAHAIIAVRGKGLTMSGNEGGWYESAHLDGVTSEKVVHSSHCTRREPDTIQEARRMLREHMLDTAVKPGISVAQSR